MAPPKEPNEELKFVMMCIKYSETELKPNFDEVAREVGAKSANACYQRLWAIKRKLGMTGTGHKRGTAGDGVVGTDTTTAAAAAVAAATGARKRKTTAAKVKDEDGSGDESTSVKDNTNKKKRVTKKAPTTVKEEADDDVDIGTESAPGEEVKVEVEA
ncbi:hypothetical protein PV08_03831 [Exophiala spinifera]|uniref:Myb-like DNA-binding domain-containing protein n=1 Tax=Exophiala spinifera TaxID=91928 RepID=A0A0D2BCD8_9EURO|nr:uncharacterized protein PV08_03831 [Exophiala spinifera]KIW16643.1 hypothetical protein PV08_03831 [Exophiala spinifera]